MADIPGGLVEWLAGGERGLSSNQIVESLCGINANGGRWSSREIEYPRDPADLGRCEKLLDAVPLLRLRLPEMSGVSREWAALVPAWSELVALMTEEAPNWREHKGRSPLAYARMKSLFAAAKEST